MDEDKDEDVSGSTAIESCEETVCDQVASGDSEKTGVLEPVASEAQVQDSGAGAVSGSDSRSGEGVVAEEGGSYNEKEIMVEVMGSDICVESVDGVCIRDSGDDDGGNSSLNAAGSQGGSGERGSEEELKHLGSGGGEACDSDSKASLDSGVEALNLGTEHEVGKSSGFAESKEEGQLEEGETTIGEVSNVVRDDTAYDSTSRRVGGGDSLDMRLGSAVEGSTSEEIPVVAENLAVATGEESLEGVGMEDINPQEIRLSENETQDQRVENGVGSSSSTFQGGGGGEDPGMRLGSAVEGSTSEEIPVVARNLAVATGEGRLEGGLGTEDANSQEIRLSENETQDQRVENGLGSSSSTLQGVGTGDSLDMRLGNSVEASTNEDIAVVADILIVAAGKKSLEGGLGTEDVHSQDIRLSENETQDQRVENGVGDSIAVIGSSAGEQVVIAVEKSESAQESVDHAKETNGRGADAFQESETQKTGVLQDEVWKPGIETTGAPSSAVMEDSSTDTQVVEEETAGMADNKNLNPKIEATMEETHDNDAVKGVTPNSEKDSVSTEKDAILNATSNLLDGQAQISVDGKNASLDNEEVGSPGIEDMQSSQQPNQVVVGGEILATEDKMLLNSIKDNLITADCLDQRVSHCSAQGHSDVEPESAEQAGIQKEQGKIETSNGSTINRSNMSLDSTTSCQPAQAVVDDEVTEMDVKVHSDPNSKGLVHMQLDVMLSSSGNNRLLETEADHEKGDIQTTSTCKGKVLTSSAKVSEPVETDQELKLENCLDKSAVCDPAEGNSSMGYLMDDQEQITQVEELGGEEKKVTEQHSKAASVGASTETDSKLLDGGQIVVVNNDMTVASNTELAVPAEGKQHLMTEEGLDESACNDVFDIESDLGKETAAQEHIEEDQQLKFEEGLDETASHDVFDIESDMGKLTAAQEHVEEDQHLKFEEGLEENASHDVFDIESDIGRQTADQEHDAEVQQIALHEGQEIEAEQPKTTDDKQEAALPPENTVKAYQATYQLPPDDEGEFSVSDLVWGKVRSHPWWPGQIFDPSDASEKAMKYYKRDCFLVAYFGDRTFAWNEASLLKPFRSNFSLVEKQSNSEIFQNAVDCALEEVSRRVEFGLACSCLPRNMYDKIKFQIVENAGIRQESSVRDSVDESLHADVFGPDKLVEYMKALGQSPAGGADRLELVIAKSQLLSFYRLKGYSQLPEFQFCGGLLENADTLPVEDEVTEGASALYKDDGQSSSGQEILQTQRSSYHKRKHNLKDTIYPRKKERSLSELMDDSWDSVDDEIGADGKPSNKLLSPSSGKKRRGSDSFADDAAMIEGRKTISLAKVSTPVTLPKPSFKIGECIRRVASQMTGSPSILRPNSQKPDGGSDGLVGDGSDILIQHSEDLEMRRMNVPTEYSSLDELLSQLLLAARDPLKGYSFLTVIISFFSDFRNTVIMEKHHDKVGGKRRPALPSISGSPETFEFEDMNDTYWTDRVIHNGSEEQPPRKSRKRDTHLVSVNLDKPLNRSNSRKRYSDGNGGLSSEKPVGYSDENAPAELVMHFPVVDSVPSETSLNKMFRRFGPLKEYETETDKDTNRARVVFKKCSDAEAAYGSAPKFNIFGSTLVNYQLNYTISVPFKTQPVATLPGEEDETLFLQF
ncbi:uncharacterized protein LOC8263371 isoform X2 [Ricinus communis]|uniref:uncharacterized protein LOC8263371 isoform X2 n=1 Tax=Ricinus communis TaxID=3988 RepID=UPI00201B227B|nr:uncharacterized protein LOC8263371 isoform X2 [Ricinus communis]